MNSYGGYDGAGDDGVEGGVVGGVTQDDMWASQVHFYGIATVLCVIMSVFVIMLIFYMLFAFASKYMPSPPRYDDERDSFAGLKSYQLPFQGNLPNARYLSTDSSRFLGASDGGPSFWNIGDVDKTAEALNRMNKSVTRDGTNDMDDFGEVVKGQNGDVNAYGKVDTRKEIIGRDKMGPGQYYKFYGRGGPSRFI